MTTVPPVRGVVKEESVEEEEEEVMETQPPCAPPPHSHPDTGHLSAAQIFSPLKVALDAIIHSLTTPPFSSRAPRGCSYSYSYQTGCPSLLLPHPWRKTPVV